MFYEMICKQKNKWKNNQPEAFLHGFHDTFTIAGGETDGSAPVFKDVKRDKGHCVWHLSPASPPRVCHAQFILIVKPPTCRLINADGEGRGDPEPFSRWKKLLNQWIKQKVKKLKKKKSYLISLFQSESKILDMDTYDVEYHFCPVIFQLSTCAIPKYTVFVLPKAGNTKLRRRKPFQITVDTFRVK